MKTNYYRLILMFVVLVMCVFRFGYIYQDSIQYIWFTQYFTGIGGITIDVNATILDEFVLRAPFVYRPLVPIITAFCGGGFDAALIMSIINVAVLCVMTDMVFNICYAMTGNTNMAFAGTLITVVSYPLVFYGPVPLTDAIAMLCFVGLIACSENNYGDEWAAIIIFIGVFVKEIMLILGLFYVLRTGLKRLWVLIPGGIAALSLRLFLGMENSLVFNLNILERPEQVLLMFAVTFAFPVLAYLVMRKFFDRESTYVTKRGKKIFIAGILVTLPLIFLGLFFAYFDGRFLWPTLIILGIYISSLR